MLFYQQLSNRNNDDEEDDPLDAFMAGIENEVEVSLRNIYKCSYRSSCFI